MNIYQSNTCQFCNKKLYGKRLPIHENVCLSNPNRTIFKHSEESKKRQSIVMKQYLKDNPDKHPWKNKNKFISKPCENIKDYLRKNNISFIEEWTPLEDRYYSIDIAFPDRKVGIEVNGNQHYNRDGSLKPYYQERHDLIVEAGWKLIEVHYTSTFDHNNIKEIIDLDKQPDYTIYFEEKERKRLNKEKNISLPLGVKNRIRYDKLALPRIESIMKADIDYSKLGWLTKAGIIIGMKAAGTKKFMKRYMPEVYESAYKRGSPTY